MSLLLVRVFQLRQRSGWSGVFVTHPTRSQFVNHASDQLDAAQKIVDADVFVWSMRIRAGVTRAERRHRSRRLRDSTDRSYWSTRRIHRIDHRRLAEDFGSRFDDRARDTRLRRRLREWRTAQLDDLNISKTTNVEMLAQEFDKQLGREIRDEPEIKTRHRSARQDRFRPRFGVAGVNAADRAGRTK